MKYIVTSILAIGGLAWVLVAAIPSSESADTSFAAIQRNMTDNRALLVDVRTPQEFADGHIDGAVNIPVEMIEAGSANVAEDTDVPLYVYCRSGNRSATAKASLEQQGYSQVIDLGAMTDVAEKGGTVVTPASL